MSKKTTEEIEKEEAARLETHVLLEEKLITPLRSILGFKQSLKGNIELQKQAQGTLLNLAMSINLVGADPRFVLLTAVSNFIKEGQEWKP